MSSHAGRQCRVLWLAQLSKMAPPGCYNSLKKMWICKYFRIAITISFSLNWKATLVATMISFSMSLCQWNTKNSVHKWEPVSTQPICNKPNVSRIVWRHVTWHSRTPRPVTKEGLGVGQLRWQCYRRHQQNPQPCPDSVVLAQEEKKEEYAKPRL